MEFGLGIPHTGKLASPEYVRDFCQAADELGYEGGANKKGIASQVSDRRIETELEPEDA